MKTIFAMIAFLLSGGAQPAFAATPPPAPATPEEIVAYHDSGEWDADIDRVIRRARRFLRARLDHTERPAIVLDIDDTSLSNYACLKRVDFDRSKADCGEQDLPAIPQTRGLYRFARRHHVAVFFITGRRASVRTTTIANLHREGYGGGLNVKLRPTHQRASRYDGWKARTRRKIIARGYRILANIGDQRSDLDGGAALRAFKLPNPMYVIPKA
jgi:HAD superfamily, subfamily IIIB (Acid phosphatase)